MSNRYSSVEKLPVEIFRWLQLYKSCCKELGASSKEALVVLEVLERKIRKIGLAKNL